jgi:acyl-CoA synthetase (AMP-forming)/AMP-acid ligase II
MIYIWRGFHNLELMELIDLAWKKGDLLVLCPNYVKDFDFVLGLPRGPIQLVGAWDEVNRRLLEVVILERKFQPYPQYPALGVFTTGTTSGKPRLILYSKNNIISSLESIRSVFNLEKLTTLFCYPQPTHAFGLILGYLHAYLFKLKLITGSGRYSKAYHDRWVAAESKGFLTLGTPTHFEDLLIHLTNRRISPKGSYSSIVGGARTSVSQWKRLQNDLHIEAPTIGYGATEVALGVTHHLPGLMPVEDGEIGFPLPHIQIKNIEGQGFEVIGPSVCLAIIENGQARFPNTILLRDNLSVRAEDKVYIYKGRFELILNRGGFKFSLEHFEKTLLENLNTRVVCVSVPDQRLGEELGVLAIDGERDRIFEVLYKTFGHSFNKSHFKLIEEFPLNTNLKVDRQECARYFQDDAQP